MKNPCTKIGRTYLDSEYRSYFGADIGLERETVEAVISAIDEGYCYLPGNTWDPEKEEITKEKRARLINWEKIERETKKQEEKRIEKSTWYEIAGKTSEIVTARLAPNKRRTGFVVAEIFTHADLYLAVFKKEDLQ